MMLFDFIRRFWLINPRLEFFPPISGGSGAANYEIGHSLRFRFYSSAYLSRTMPSAGNRTTWTLSLWVKRGALNSSSRQCIFSAGAPGSGASSATIYLDYASRCLDVHDGGSILRSSTRELRDFAGHFHLTIVADTNNATGSERLRVSINNERVTSWTTNVSISSGYQFQINTAVAHAFGRATESSAHYFDGLLSEIHFVDGQALAPTDFGTYDANGVWVPKAYTGTYGANGFYLPFNDGTNLTTLGADRSGNGNNWTLNNFSLTDGPSYDWLSDTPTNNFPTLNPLSGGGYAGYAGNLNATFASGSMWHTWLGTQAFPESGKFYFEATVLAQYTGAAQWNMNFGIAPASLSVVNGGANQIVGSMGSAGVVAGYSVAIPWGQPTYKAHNGAINYIGSAISAAVGETWGLAVDMDAGKIWFHRLGTYLEGDPATGVSPSYSDLSGSYVPAVCIGVTSNLAQLAFNFGQRPFAYAPPAGFKALCTANMPAATIANPKEHVGIVLHATNGAASQSFTGMGFEADMLWSKSRANAYPWLQFDRLRGVANYLAFNSSAAEVNYPSGLLSLDPDGFTVGAGFGADASRVMYGWKAGGAAVTNTDGTITSQVSANQEAGFSIVSFTAPSSGAYSVGHGLAKKPAMLIVKSRSANAIWSVSHISAGGGTSRLQLESTAAATTGVFTSPDASKFYLPSSYGDSGSYIAYCFAEIPGHSKFGAYIGNGSADGPFVYCGFLPRFLLVRRADGVGNWIIIDTARDPINDGVNQWLYPNLTNAEGATSAAAPDFLSNGFKWRAISDAINGSGATYIFMAFAEHPFGGSNVSPCPAR